MLPTAARAVAAICLGILAFIASEMAKTQWPEGTYFGNMSRWNALIGFLVGWIMLGPRAGRGYMTGLSNGFTIAVFGTVLVLLIHGADEMVDLAMRNRYGGFMDAISGIFQNAIDIGFKVARQDILTTLFVGGCISGILTEWTAKRWR